MILHIDIDRYMIKGDIKRAAKYLSRRLAALLHWYMPIRFESDHVNTCFCKVGAFVKMHFAPKAIYTRALYSKSQLKCHCYSVC